jgi:hypothetical protein
VIERIGCNNAEAPTDSNCIKYRERCPQYACPANTAVADTTSGDLACDSTIPPPSGTDPHAESTGRLPSGAVAGIALACAAAGIAIGAIGKAAFGQTRGPGGGSFSELGVGRSLSEDKQV